MKNLTNVLLLTITLFSFSSCLKGLGEKGNELGEGCGQELGEQSHQTCTANNKTTGFIAPADSVVLAGATYHECRDINSNPALCKNGSVFHTFGGTIAILKTFKLNPTATKVCFLGDGVSYMVTGSIPAQTACI